MTNSQLAGIKFQQAMSFSLAGAGLGVVSGIAFAKSGPDEMAMPIFFGASAVVCSAFAVIRFYEGSNLLIKGNGIVIKF